MKSKVLAILLVCMFVLLSCVGCNLGSYYENNKKDPNADTGTNNPSDNPNVDPDDPIANDKHYTVTVYYGSSVFEPTEEMNITVVWRNKNDVVRAPLGQNGRADAGELDGTYTVYLEGLPSDYSYNPNGYTATSNDRSVSILLTSIRNPDSGNGSSLYVNNGCYSVRDDGTYRANISDAEATLFYEYKPRAAGVYVIESWVNIYDDAVNPIFTLYGGTNSYKWRVGKLEGGAFIEGGHTKNFRHEFTVAASEVGNVCTFEIGADVKSKEYPTYVDFAISYLGPYTSSYADIRLQSAKQARGKTPEPNAGETFVYADMGTRLFDASKFKVSPNTGRYHVYDAEKYADNPYGYGKGYGPMLMCDLKGSLPSYTVVPSLYNSISIGPSGSNYLMLYNMWLEDEQKFAVFDYTNFIRVDYANVCNSDGKCYVTEELRTFLQKFAENHSLYTDGVGPGEGTPEEGGYSANQDALWLFACGFYQ